MNSYGHCLFLNAALLAVSSVLAAAPISAQEALNGRLVTSSVGQVGRRQDQTQAAPNVKPMTRVNNRIENRVRSRISSRIDRDYAPPADTLSAFTSAAQASASSKTGGR